MGILDRLRGKKKDDLGLDPFPGSAPGMQGPQGEDPFNTQFPDFGSPMGAPDQGGFPQSQPPAQYPGANPAPQQQQSFTPESLGFDRIPNNSNSYNSQGGHQQSLGEINIGKDLEIISAKLDAIKAELDSVNQRLKRVERLAEGTSGATPKDAWSY